MSRRTFYALPTAGCTLRRGIFVGAHANFDGECVSVYVCDFLSLFSCTVFEMFFSLFLLCCFGAYYQLAHTGTNTLHRYTHMYVHT